MNEMYTLYPSFQAKDKLLVVPLKGQEKSTLFLLDMPDASGNVFPLITAFIIAVSLIGLHMGLHLNRSN